FANRKFCSRPPRSTISQPSVFEPASSRSAIERASRRESSKPPPALCSIAGQGFLFAVRRTKIERTLARKLLAARRRPAIRQLPKARRDAELAAPEPRLPLDGVDASQPVDLQLAEAPQISRADAAADGGRVGDLRYRQGSGVAIEAAKITEDGLAVGLRHFHQVHRVKREEELESRMYRNPPRLVHAALGDAHGRKRRGRDLVTIDRSEIVALQARRAQLAKHVQTHQPAARRARRTVALARVDLDADPFLHRETHFADRVGSTQTRRPICGLARVDPGAQCGDERLVAILALTRSRSARVSSPTLLRSKTTRSPSRNATWRSVASCALPRARRRSARATKTPS